MMANNNLRIYLTNKVPLFDESGKKVIGILGISLDITERKLAEKKLIEAKEAAEKADRAKQTFLKNMRHDLRTPFSGILTLADLLAQHETDSKKKADLETIVGSAQVLLDYMNMVLDQARRGESSDEVHLVPVDLKQLIADALATVKPALVAKSIALVLDYPENVPTTFNSDAGLLQRIVINLLGNATKFTPDGEIKVSVRVLKQEDNQVSLAIAIADTGIGIPEDKRDSIFEKFTRLEAAYKGNYSGMGLGLHDVTVMCTQLNAKIGVEHNTPKGTIFTCTIPLTISTARVADPKSAVKSDISYPPLPPLRILLVEDQPVAAMVASRFLTEAGHTVDVAVSGEEAIEKSAQECYDVVLLDIGLPNMSGCDVARHLRVREKTQGGHMLLVGLTAHEEDEAGKMCKDAGMDAVVFKPVNIKKIEKTLRPLLCN